LWPGWRNLFTDSIEKLSIHAEEILLFVFDPPGIGLGENVFPERKKESENGREETGKPANEKIKNELVK
tara:strand:+ start:1230 stop:1436 length:207 start_codon:yes stop_codon:yes gene_type:complete